MAHSSTNESHEQMTERIAETVMHLGYRDGAAFINAECAKGQHEYLECVLDAILNPRKKIDDLENIDWCKWLIAGGRSPDEFATIVRAYDNHAKCGLVWIPHVVAYRCRTCGISPCMSICRNCFKKGDHSTHDFNMFLSQAGGACDCGDTSVMKAEGFCSDHGINNHSRDSSVPKDLMAVADAVMPRLLLRLLYHFRDNGEIKACDAYCSMLMELNNMGELMRNVMTKTLLDKQLYAILLDPGITKSYADYLEQSIIKYKTAKSKLESPKAPKKYKDFPALQSDITHTTLLEELIFWTFKYEFPQNFVCFLLNMLPDPEYKEQLTRTFVMHYSRIPKVLETSSDPDTLSNRVVHMSVQLFSNESLALKMVEELDLLHVMIISLKAMMSQNLIRNTLHDEDRNSHNVIDCATKAMKEHCYWPLVSDFNNVLSHESVALVFLRDDDLVNMWFQFLSMLQGMNVNVRETGTHIEYEPSSYYAAFSCELEASAYPMWSIISHLNDSTHAQLAKKIIMFCTNYLQDWLKAIYQSKHEKGELGKDDKNEMMKASFHFPLHRYLAAFTCQAVSKMNMTIKDIIPPPDLLTLLMIHPLRVQSFFYEILSGIWIRNGLQIKGQAMTYIQANFCNSMVDMDLFFLQICAIQLPPKIFLLSAIESFGVSDWLGMCPLSQPQEMEQDLMMEGLLTFLSTIVSSRTNLGNDEKAQCIIEISALLATGDKTHSQLLELMPERSGNSHTRNFEKYLSELSVFKGPPISSENLEQGLFMPIADVWEKHYDPLHVLLRAVHRRDFQNSMDRFQNFVKHEKKMPKSGNLWPPFRIPGSVGEFYSDPSCILHSRILHSMILGILYRAVHLYNVSEHMLSLAIFLLEMAVTHTNNVAKDALECNQKKNTSLSSSDVPELLNVYSGDCLAVNLRYHVSRIALTSVEPQNSPANYSNTTFDSDLEWDVSENEPLQTLMPNNNQMESEQSPTSFDIALPQDLSIVREQSLVLRGEQSMDEDSISMAALQPYTSLPPNENVQAIAEYTPRRLNVEQTGSTHLALAPTHIPPEIGMEVVVRGNFGLVANDETTRPQAEMFSHANPGTILPFQRVQPVAVPSRNMDIVASTTNNQRRMHSSTSFKSKLVENSSMSNSDFIVIEESILSLLLKLHSQLSGTLDSFSFEEATEVKGRDAMETNEAGPSSGSSNASQSIKNVFISDSRIGDGPYFIGNLLKKMAKSDDDCAQSINEIRQRLWPNQREKQAEQTAKESKEKEDRSKRARERQQRLMEEFANKQKKFMEQTAEDMDCCDDDQDNVEVLREKEYVCIICNRTSPSSESNPIGLVVLIESSGVVGHRRKYGERFILPLNDDEVKGTPTNDRLATEFNQRHQLLTNTFGEESWFLTSNDSFESGIFVQSCGHYVHLMCHEAYLNSLHSQRQQSLNVERGEFLCPVCRQLSNAVLPLSPQTETPSSVVRSKDEIKKEFLLKSLLHDLTILIKENERPPASMQKATKSTKLWEAMGRAMEIITDSTHPKLYKPSRRRLFLFVTSIARTNLEAEIIQRGGSLCTNNMLRYKPKRECLVPLLNLLSVNLRFFVEWPLWKSFASLYEVQIADSASVPSHYQECVPSLLADPIALLIKFTLLAPLRMDLVYFNCIVKVVYNLLYYQVIVKLCTTLTEMECDHIIAKYSMDETIDICGFSNLGSAMAFVLKNMNKCKHLRLNPTFAETDGAFASSSSSSSPSPSSSTASSQINLNLIEQQLQKLCLPFLRVAALLRHHLYEQDLPEISLPQMEFVCLVYFLELVTIDINWDSFDAAKALCFVPGNERTLPKFWCDQLMELYTTDDQNKAMATVISSHHTLWQQPKLLSLPREYERLFTYYHEKACSNCDNIPRECSICLLCGTIVCLKQRCCIESNCCEAVRHSMRCGGGTGIFLVVPSTYIIVIRGRRACLWGSLYLDDFFEEDRDLRRGRPLYLNEDRFSLLESQWLSHRFAHTKHTWVFHRDSL